MAKTLAEQIADLRRKTDERIAELTKQNAILQHLIPLTQGYKQPSIHFYKLYSSIGGINFKPETYMSLRDPNEKQPDADLLRALLTTYPPVPAVKVKDSAVSFRPDFGESYSTENRPADEYECYGVTVYVESQHREAHLQWFSPVGGELWRFDFQVAWHSADFGVLDMVARRYSASDKVSSWERCELKPNHDAQRIRWSAGAPEYPNNFTLYWDRHTGASLDFPAIAFAKVR